MFRTVARRWALGTQMRQCRGLAASAGKPGGPRGKILLALGALAVGLTVVAATYNKDAPKSAIEPRRVAPGGTADARTFKDGDVSIVFVLGGPGSGKGTQCANLVKEHGFVHLLAGDLLRAEQARPGSQYGELIAQHIRDGLIVPQEVTVALLDHAVQENYRRGATKFLIDGFPRKMDQALTFERQIATLALTLFFECPEAVMLARLLERGKTSGRADDNIDSIRKRFRVFVDTSMPVVDYYDKQGKVVRISCDQPVAEVYRQVEQALAARGI